MTEPTDLITHNEPGPPTAQMPRQRRRLTPHQLGALLSIPTVTAVFLALIGFWPDQHWPRPTGLQYQPALSPVPAAPASSSPPLSTPPAPARKVAAVPRKVATPRTTATVVVTTTAPAPAPTPSSSAPPDVCDRPNPPPRCELEDQLT